MRNVHVTGRALRERDGITNLFSYLKKIKIGNKHCQRHNGPEGWVFLPKLFLYFYDKVSANTAGSKPRTAKGAGYFHSVNQSKGGYLVFALLSVQFSLNFNQMQATKHECKTSFVPTISGKTIWSSQKHFGEGALCVLGAKELNFDWKVPIESTYLNASDDLVKVSWKLDARKCQNQVTHPSLSLTSWVKVASLFQECHTLYQY